MTDSRADANRLLDVLVPPELPEPRHRGEVTDPSQRARSFVRLKLDATFHAGDQIKMASAVLIQHIRTTDVAFRVIVDSFLFEASSVRDALGQLANAVFDLRIPIDSPELGKDVIKKLKGTATGLDPWFQRDKRPEWLSTLLRLRHATTHRDVLRLPTQYSWPGGVTT